jgi:hypothetical protein
MRCPGPPRAGKSSEAGIFSKRAPTAADQYEIADYKRVEVILRSGLRAWVYVEA